MVNTSKNVGLIILMARNYSNRVVFVKRMCRLINKSLTKGEVMRKAQTGKLGLAYGHRIATYTGLSGLAFWELTQSHEHALLATLAICAAALGLLVETLATSTPRSQSD
ncbi:hypothetical protein [Salinivibrio sp. YCSC6]|uniref:hypothetical protein n=1 Tax=Salinivibrio sp. YCSC6 TaxID=2003370 RepID=UPI000BBCC9FB|nr:hypothetical protein [Salinivibrio sp. YCSC6]PCE68400.1 hypothetical protein B6G00_08960 [Salinivibrio sp. YCSC6]QCF34716.1 hypothetical protein E8E00_00070 [Salinivibrio sp. YCSC6]